MITYKLDRVKGELKGINSEFDGGGIRTSFRQSTGENLTEFHQKLTGGQIAQNMLRIYAEYSADLHSEKIGSRRNRHGR